MSYEYSRDRQNRLKPLSLFSSNNSAKSWLKTYDAKMGFTGDNYGKPLPVKWYYGLKVSDDKTSSCTIYYQASNKLVKGTA